MPYCVHNTLGISLLRQTPRILLPEWPPVALHPSSGLRPEQPGHTVLPQARLALGEGEKNGEIQTAGLITPLLGVAVTLSLSIQSLFHAFDEERPRDGRVTQDLGKSPAVLRCHEFPP
jgi:hypothetical protein